jgi:hypothetical protein
MLVVVVHFREFFGLGQLAAGAGAAYLMNKWGVANAIREGTRAACSGLCWRNSCRTVVVAAGVSFLPPIGSRA